MSRRPVILIALAGAASIAAAQPTINITADVTGGFFDTVNWTISATGVSPGDFLQAYDFNIVGIGTATYSISEFSTNLSLVVGATAGTPSGGDVLGVSGGQSSLVDPLNTVFGDVILGTFTTQCESFGSISFTLEDGGVLGAPIARFRAGSDLGPITFEGDDIDIVSASVIWFPAPSTATLIAAGALFAARRRRS